MFNQANIIFSGFHSTIELGDSSYFTHIRSSAIGAFWGWNVDTYNSGDNSGSKPPRAKIPMESWLELSPL